MAEKVDADVLIYGHTHKSYRKDCNGRIFINAGSEGKPKDGDPRACVAMVDITPDGVKVDFLREPDDVDEAAAAIVASELPPYCAERLREAK